MKIWLIADTHFFHDKLAEICDRPADFTVRITENWRRMVSPDDMVIHLGDVAIGKRGPTRELLQSLPGRKILILGNHDHESVGWYIDSGFAMVCQSMVFRNVLLTHAPSNELPANAVLNVHGHLHNNAHRFAEYEPKPWHKLLAVETTLYCPVMWEKFIGPQPLIQL